jgi:hypothetical protein
MELIIGMVLLSIVCTAILSMIMSQSRFVGQINTDVQMLDQVRAANELLGSEIADLPRGAVLFARRDSISYRLPVMWGIVCGPTDRQAIQAKKTKLKAGEAAVTKSTNMALNLEEMPDVLGDPTPEGLGVSANGTSFSYYKVAVWSALALVRSDSAANSCLDAPPAPVGKKKAPRPKKNALPPPPAQTVIESQDNYYETKEIGNTIMSAAPPERALILGYIQVDYYLKPVTSGGNALYRHTSSGSQKLAWPFSETAGFTYRLDDNTSSTTIAALDLPRIRAVRVDLPATRTARNKTKADTLSVQPWIPLFNAR